MRAFPVLIFVLVLALYANAQTSRNGEYTANISRVAPAKNKHEHNTWSAAIVDTQGSTRYRIVKQIAYDVQYPAIYLYDDGSSIVVSAFAGELSFYDNAGNLQKTIQVFGHPTTEYEQVVKCSVARDRAAVLYSTPEQPYAVLLMFDLQADELWRNTLSAKNAGEVFLSDDGQAVAAGSYDIEKNNFRATETFDGSGKSLRTFPILFRYADIAGDGRIVLADRDNALIAFLSSSENPAKWIRSSGNLITSVRIVDGFVAVVAESINLPQGSPVYSNPLLIVLDAKGKKIAGTELHSSSAHSATLIVDRGNIILKSSSSQASISRSSLKQE